MPIASEATSCAMVGASRTFRINVVTAAAAVNKPTMDAETDNGSMDGNVRSWENRALVDDICQGQDERRWTAPVLSLMSASYGGACMRCQSPVMPSTPSFQGPLNNRICHAYVTSMLGRRPDKPGRGVEELPKEYKPGNQRSVREFYFPVFRALLFPKERDLRRYSDGLSCVCGDAIDYESCFDPRRPRTIP